MSEYIQRKKENRKKKGEKERKDQGRRERERGRLCVFYNVLQGGKKWF